jgi:predicted Zn-dependent peptidase
MMMIDVVLEALSAYFDAYSSIEAHLLRHFMFLKA